MKNNFVAVLLMGIALLQSQTVRASCGDVCYALDSSGSISTDENFQDLKDQVIEISQILDSLGESVLSAGVKFGATGPVVQTISPLTSDGGQFRALVNAESFDRGNSTPMRQALRRCRRLLRRSTSGRPQTIVVLTDGVPTPAEEDATISTAQNIRNSGIDIVAIGFDGFGPADLDFLEMIASPDSTFSSDNFELSDEVRERIARGLCGGSCQVACEQCDFQFEGESCVAEYAVPTTPNEAFTPKLVMKTGNPVIGIVNSNNLQPEFIGDDGAVTNINQCPITGQKFSRSQFKPFAIRPRSQMSGIGHENFQTAAQREKVKDKCVRVFFSAYQVLDSETLHVIDNVNNVNTKGSNCAVFRTSE